MTRQAILQALESRNYADMLAIHTQFRTDKKFDDFFNQNLESPSAMQLNMLHNKVSNIVRILDQQHYFSKSITETKLPEIGVKPTPQKTKSDKTKIVKSETVDYDALSPEMKHLYDANTILNAEMKSIHALMCAATTDVDRSVYVNRLSDLETEKHNNWVVIDAWIEKHDSTPAGTNPDAIAPISALDLAKKIASAQKYVQRVEGKETNEAQRLKVAENRKFLAEMGAKANVRKK